MNRNFSLLLLACMCLVIVPAHGMCRVASIAMCAKTVLAKKSFGPQRFMPAAVKARFTVATPRFVPAPVNHSFNNTDLTKLFCQGFNRNRTNIYSLLYGGGVLIALGAWLDTVKQKQEKEIVKNTYIPRWEDTRVRFYQELKEKPWGQVSKKYIALLEQEEQQLIDECCAIHGITRIDIQNFKLRIREAYHDAFNAQMGLLKLKFQSDCVPEFIEKIVHDTFKDFNMRASDFLILNVPPEVCGDLVSANEQAFFVNVRSQVFSEINGDRVFRSIMNHEIMHILHDDLFNNNIFKCLYLAVDATIDREKSQNFCLKYIRFIERRSDILAGLVNPRVAKDISDYFNGRVPWSERWTRDFLAWINVSQKFNDYKDYRDFSGSLYSHPSDIFRADYMKKLHDEIIKSAEQKNA